MQNSKRMWCRSPAAHWHGTIPRMSTRPQMRCSFKIYRLYVTLVFPLNAERLRPKNPQSSICHSKILFHIRTFPRPRKTDHSFLIPPEIQVPEKSFESKNCYIAASKMNVKTLKLRTWTGRKLRKRQRDGTAAGIRHFLLKSTNERQSPDHVTLGLCLEILSVNLIY